ncbi:MAG: adenosylmethionine decarboxylase [Alphaproteobacteria bacterium]|nr:MAG: adenosylmethionine decarboxylase [Alphaproteobacteria bacterium]
MQRADLFQLGIGLETGAHEEDTAPRGIAATDEFTADTATVAQLADSAREDHFIRRDGAVFAGTHLIIEVVNGHGLDDEARIRRAFLDSVEAAGATLLHIHTHKFTPQGVSGVAVLAESHISVHTWPEIGYGAFDVFMCGDADPWAAVPILKRAFGTEDVRVRELRRGEGVVEAALAAEQAA